MTRYSRSKLGSYGGLAGYHGFEGFGEITQGNIDAVIGTLQTAQGFFSQSQQASGAVRSSFLSNTNSTLQQASSLAKSFADQLRREGKTRESGLLDTVFLEAHQMSVGQIGYDNFGRVIGLAKAAKTGLRLVAALTPQQSAATASRITQRQNTLESKIRQAGVSDLSKHAALQSEWAGISRSIRDASLLKSDRDRLLARQNQLLSTVEKTVITATRRTEPPPPPPGTEEPGFWTKFTSFFTAGPSLSIPPPTATATATATTTKSVVSAVAPTPTRTVAPTPTPRTTTQVSAKRPSEDIRAALTSQVVNLEGRYKKTDPDTVISLARAIQKDLSSKPAWNESCGMFSFGCKGRYSSSSDLSGRLNSMISFANKKKGEFTGEGFKQVATGVASILDPLAQIGTDIASIHARSRIKPAGPSQSQAILAAMLQNQPTQAKDNTMLYVGIALGGAALLSVLVIVALKK